MGYRIGIDVGGTFTDFLLVDEKGDQKIFKTPSIPEDPSVGVLNGLREIAASEASTLKDFLSEVDIIVHGTTITTNAVITRKYAKTGFVTTEGFRDYLNERRGMKDSKAATMKNGKSATQGVYPECGAKTLKPGKS